MAEFLPRNRLWARLTTLTLDCPAQCWAAAPYLGRGARTLLHLKRGDVVICAMTEANVRSGAVCPDEIDDMQQHGVRVYTQDALHAKIYVIGDVGIVCSANMSLHSVQALDEAGLLTRDAKVVAELRQWFQQRMTTLVSPGWLQRMRPLYPPPRPSTRPSSEIDEGSHGDEELPPGRLWIAVARPTTFPPNEEEHRQRCEATASERISHSAYYELQTTRWTVTPQLQFGDFLVQIWDEAGVWMVYPHARVLEIVTFTTPAGRPRAYVSVELPHAVPSLSYAQLVQQCAVIGFHLPTDPNELDVLQITQQNIVLLVRGLTAFDPEVVA